MLQQYIQLGMELKTVHRVLAFTQRARLRPFIDFNTEKCEEGKHAPEKAFFKLMNYAAYGKYLENM